MAGRHSIATRRRARALEMVEVSTHVTHLLTPQALDAGKRASGGYVAVCGSRVIPAPTAEPGGSYCRSCTGAIPTRRSREARWPGIASWSSEAADVRVPAG